MCYTKTVKKAYERAQKESNDFSSLPDDELARQMRVLDEAEKDIINDANRERDEIIQSEFSQLLLFLLHRRCQMKRLTEIFCTFHLFSGAPFGKAEVRLQL